MALFNLLIGLLAIIIASYTLARYDILFTYVGQWRAKAVTYGGQTHKKWIVNIPQPKTYYHPETGLIMYDLEKDDVPDGFIPAKGSTGGLYWIGFPFQVSIYEYKFEWGKYLGQKENPDDSIEHRSEYVKSVYVQSVYGFVVKSAETLDDVPLDMLFTVKVKHHDLSLAIYGIPSGWLTASQGYLEAITRERTGITKFEDVKKMSETGSRKQNFFGTEISEIDRELSKLYGPRFESIEFISYKIVGESGLGQKLQEASTRKFVAEKDKEARVIAADTKFYEKQKENDAEKERLQKVEGERLKQKQKELAIENAALKERVSVETGSEAAVAVAFANRFKGTQITNVVEDNGGSAQKVNLTKIVNNGN